MIAGITGHQELGDAESVAWTESALRHQVIVRGVSTGLTSLAAGTDQLFAGILRSLGVGFEVVVPCQHYERSFRDDRAATLYQQMIASASHTHLLDYAAPSEEAYFAAGKWIVEHCDMLIAVWNGRPARGIGGTGDIVKLAKTEHRQCVHINPVTRIVGEL